MTVAPITVLGAGSWGTALALLLARNGNPTTLWTHESDHAEHRDKYVKQIAVFFPKILVGIYLRYK